MIFLLNNNVLKVESNYNVGYRQLFDILFNQIFIKQQIENLNRKSKML